MKPIRWDLYCEKCGCQSHTKEKCPYIEANHRPNRKQKILLRPGARIFTGFRK